MHVKNKVLSAKSLNRCSLHRLSCLNNPRNTGTVVVDVIAGKISDSISFMLLSFVVLCANTTSFALVNVIETLVVIHTSLSSIIR